ncbi:MAG: ATP-dependent DNA helicase RecG [Gammaproteobacteria bacterium CG_4_10_14_0_8_um_filter_38_16]|nr:MAG: ATP-dependent DNA helicase RecG [Gammaproteobacteria bacterium CG_4_10_14_0_8_um_filter_38_16]PJA02962.1 MAG: ATP-dependent DNA helicase RecG [Gammaproteobacteria bacterium CG_4_10_14_0_2_um_filter_38_22]PJB11446.1 MAG: ATP-dependent DNA helicase RecG [Gammaproteobacteria bacterium CG_4_9_14_3_um_filter_38_9]
MLSTLSTCVTSLKGVGSKTAKLFAQVGMLTVQDLLFHLPLRYEDRTQIHAISAIKPGDRVLIEGVVQSVQVTGARGYLRCVIADATGRQVDLVFFYFTKPHEKKLSMLKGKAAIRCFGEVRHGFSGHLEMVHPEYATVDQIGAGSVLTLSPCLLPVYPTTKGLHQATWRKVMKQALDLLEKNNLLPELLPSALLSAFNFMELKQALFIIHFPPIDVDPTVLLAGKHPAQQRLIFEELIAHQLTLQQMRYVARQNKAVALPNQMHLSEPFIQQLPFQLTGAQQRVLSEISRDLMRDIPMMRLLQGDVGSGKTVVSCIAALQALEAGYQVALMAPTEILSEQHLQNCLKWLTPLGISVGLLMGRQTALEQKTIKAKLVSGEIQLIIGTHALFQADVEFKNLVLLIIDEQHRFGVHQRLALMQKALKKGYFPHQLMMTATPIPRTLAMTAYADLDCSVIDELPPGRQPISTAIIASAKRDEIVDRVRVNCESKKQAYWICTLIDESDVLQCQAAETTAKQLQVQLPSLKVGLIHGRLKSTEKNAMMLAFSQGKIDLLVATTVVEVGVDVANASLMIIENPERLGLAQLHQLRGRVGRGETASFCVLLYQHPLSETARKRLAVMRETQDGFLIAERDLQIRGPGDVLGTRQSGLMQLRVADLIRDQALLPMVQKISEQLIENHPLLIEALLKRWLGSQIYYMHA